MGFSTSTPRIYAILLGSVSLALVVSSAFAQKPLQIAAEGKASIVAVPPTETSPQPAIESLEISQSPSGPVIHGLFKYSVPPPMPPPTCPKSNCHVGSNMPDPSPTCGYMTTAMLSNGNTCGPYMCPIYYCADTVKPICCCSCSRTDPMCSGCSTDGYCRN